MATIRDVAKEAGVSVATVSRVLNNKGYVTKETEKRVELAIEKLKYKPNAIARSLSIRKSNIIALVVPAINNPFFPEIAKAVEDVAQAKGYKVFLCNTDDRRDRLIEYLHSLRDNFVDGIIINSENLTEADLEDLKQQDIPVITIDRVLSNQAFSSISVKNRYGGQLATNHLIQVGCQRIGHLSGPENVVTAKDRFWGYRDQLKNFDWFDQSWIVKVDFSIEGGYHGMKELFQRHPDIDGVFAANDLIAAGALKAAFEWGRKVPDDLAIVGFDGIDITELTIPRITTIQQPIYEIGKLAMEEVLRFINNSKATAKNYELDVKLIQRESTMR
mgnify:FL=1